MILKAQMALNSKNAAEKHRLVHKVAFALVSCATQSVLSKILAACASTLLLFSKDTSFGIGLVRRFSTWEY